MGLLPVNAVGVIEPEMPVLLIQRALDLHCAEGAQMRQSLRRENDVRHHEQTHVSSSEARVTRSALAIAIAVISGATLLASAAEACISCNYVPEVVNTPVPGAQKAKPNRVAKPKRVPSQEYGARPSQKRVAKRPPAAKDAPEAKAPDAGNETATATQPETDTGKTTPVERDTESATDTSTAALADQETLLI
ncbi:hypothetical protein, partial [uncultured Hyphomicrobium sp.]|uniref:hypothetical protein n=1 Tax=uncultured Hyphomicrobium sp. TaxID=194373 RepID=UPI0025FC3F68